MVNQHNLKNRNSKRKFIRVPLLCLEWGSWVSVALMREGSGPLLECHPCACAPERQFCCSHVHHSLVRWGSVHWTAALPRIHFRKHTVAFATDIWGELVGSVPEKKTWVKRILLAQKSRILNVRTKAVWQAVAPPRAGINMQSFIIGITFFPWASSYA